MRQMAQPPTRILFIFDASDGRIDARKDARQRLSVRRHAAKVAHEVRKRGGLPKRRHSDETVKGDQKSLVSNHNKECEKHKSASSTSPEMKGRFINFQSQKIAIPRSDIESRIDPFDIIAGSNTPGAIGGIEYLVKFVCPQHDSVEQPFGVVSTYGKWLLEAMAASIDLFHAVIAKMKASADLMANPDEAPSRAVIGHMTAAISHLRRRLMLPAACCDDSVLLTMVFLASLQDVLGDMEAFRIHSEQVVSTVRGKGGIYALQAPIGVKAAVYQFQRWSAPIIDVLDTSCEPTYPSQPSSEDFCKSISNLPKGFRDLATEGQLSLETIQIVQRIAIIQQYKWLHHSGDQRDFDGDHLLSGLKEQTHLDFSEACPALNHPTNTLEKLLCFALMRYCINTMSHMQPKPGVFYSTLMQLYDDLLAFEVPLIEELSQRRCLLWVWLVWIDSIADENGLIDAEGIEQICEIKIRFPETASWEMEDFAVVGNEFFVSKNVFILLRHWKAGSPCHRGCEQRACSESRITRPRAQVGQADPGRRSKSNAS